MLSALVKDTPPSGNIDTVELMNYLGSQYDYTKEQVDATRRLHQHIQSTISVEDIPRYLMAVSYTDVVDKSVTETLVNTIMGEGDRHMRNQLLIHTLMLAYTNPRYHDLLKGL